MVCVGAGEMSVVAVGEVKHLPIHVATCSCPATGACTIAPCASHQSLSHESTRQPGLAGCCIVNNLSELYMDFTSVLYGVYMVHVKFM